MAEAPPVVPDCPGWTVGDLVVHLAFVHRFVIRVVEDRLRTPPDMAGLGFVTLPAGTEGWPRPEHAPNPGPIPASLLDWFAEGAAILAGLFEKRDPAEEVWTWSAEQSVGFWLRMQTIEAAVHRWDAGDLRPFDGELATDAVSQTFEVMAPFRRRQQNAPPGEGERFRFRRTDGGDVWTVCFEGDDVRLLGEDERADVELAGTASELMLFLWQRLGAGELRVSGDERVLDRYFTLVPPV